MDYSQRPEVSSLDIIPNIHHDLSRNEEGVILVHVGMAGAFLDICIFSRSTPARFNPPPEWRLEIFFSFCMLRRRKAGEREIYAWNELFYC